MIHNEHNRISKMLLRNVCSTLTPNPVALKQRQGETPSGLVQELQLLWASGSFSCLIHACTYSILNLPSHSQWIDLPFLVFTGDHSWLHLTITVTILISSAFGSYHPGQHLPFPYTLPPALASQSPTYPIIPPSIKPVLAPLDEGSEKLVVTLKALK